MQRITLGMDGPFTVEMSICQNKAIKDLLEKNEILQEDYDILFEAKENWFDDKNELKNDYNTKVDNFKNALKIIIEKQKKSKIINLGDIEFPIIFDLDYIFKGGNFDEISFMHSVFYSGAYFKSWHHDFHVLEVCFSGAKFKQDVILNIDLFEEVIDFRDIIFEKKVEFFGTFKNDVSFEETIFNGETNFEKAVFENEVNFEYSTFSKNANFKSATFKKDVNFNKSVFEGDVILENTSLFSKLDFSEVDFRENAYLNARNMSFNKINIEGTYLTEPLLLGLTGYENEQRIPLNKNHFANKESARLIKDHFEKQNNITEANKYFVIEQEKYIEELRNNENKTDDNRVRKLIPLYFNKIVSHFGTDWVRAILILLLWGIIADNIFLLTKGNNLVFDWKYFGFIVFLALSYLATYTHNAKGKISKELFFGLLLFIYIIFVFNDSLNHIVKLLNPINAFKDNDNIFKDYEAFGTMVRIISATIIYQIIVAFRQFTRRS